MTRPSTRPDTAGSHDDDVRGGHAPGADSFSLDDRYTREQGTIYLTGVQALVRMVRDRAILDRRQNLVTASLISGYEGSPLAGYDLEIARRSRYLEPYDIVHRPGLNEEIAATSVMGSQLAAVSGHLRSATGTSAGRDLTGVTGYWYGKAPGLDRATDALRHAALIGTHAGGGAVALVGDDPGAKSSTVPCASEMALADMYMPILYPADAQDVLDLGVHAAIMSRVSGLWTSMKISAHVADGSSTAEVHPDRILPVYGDLGESPHRPSAKLLGANLMELENNQLTVRIPRAMEYARSNRLNRLTVRTADDRIGIVAAGKTYLDMREALRRLGLTENDLAREGIRVLKLGMVYPFERQILDEFVRGLDEVIVVEEKRDFIETMMRDILFGRPLMPRIVGKRNEDGSTLFSTFGELDVDAVARGLAHRLGRVHGVASAHRWLVDGTGRRERITLPLVTRSPYFCSGCPHNSSTKVADDTLVGAGIGCHAMVLLMDPAQVGEITGVTQMGGEGAQWIGMNPFVTEKHFVQNIGDGTFMHSGSLAVRAAVASGANITYKLLFNGTVAMTGGQDPVGRMTLPEIVRLLQAEKVVKIVVTTDDVATVRKQGLPKGVDVRPRADLMEVQRELAAVPGVTVLVHDQHCAAEKRRKRKRGKVPTPTQRVVINERICEGCGDCGQKSNCLSVHPVDTEFGRKTRIDQSSCNLDYSCLEGDCPSFVTVEPGDADATKATRPVAPDLYAAELAAPEGRETADAVPVGGAGTLPGGESFALRITGIGGTGIVTVSAVLATAAVLDGRFARTVDMTGLAQKGGAVVSDVKISAAPLEEASKLAAGGADLYLACDGLVGADPRHLRASSSRRTVAVLSSSRVPTGEMVIDTAVTYPGADSIENALAEASKRCVSVDAAEMALQLFGDKTFANMLLVGAAFQAGALPVSAAAVERAIDLNGVAVARNIQAFRRGRQVVAEPQAVAATIAALHPVPVPVPVSAVARRLADGVLGGVANTEGAGAAGMAELRHCIELRVDELIAYQDEAYARRYAEALGRVWRVERAAAGDETAGDAGASVALTTAVAHGLHKLMAYKDEYEVARLALDPAFAEQIADEYGADAKVSLRLHPPALRALGMREKIRIGAWGKPAIKALARMKKLRGTRFDPFGPAKVRRVERELIGEYLAAVERMLERLAAARGGAQRGAAGDVPGTLAVAVEVAELPTLVRGYEDIKLRNVEAFRAELARLAE